MARRLLWALRLTTALATSWLVGCDGGEEGVDSGAETSCEGLADGAPCGSDLVCVGGACVTSTCGDGVVLPPEQCDDGNQTQFDGCEPMTCLFTCVTDGECGDSIACNGAETCTDNVCTPGTPLGDGDACVAMGMNGVCRSGMCVRPGCGNGVLDGDEQCDDMNDVDGDGCETDCTFTCETDADCSDGSVCTGEETCDTVAHLCQAGTPITCDDSDACTADECDPEMGCVFPLIDGDMDGHAAESLGACGTDCNDMRADVNPDEQEQCDAIDHDCDGSPIPPATPFWYLDCDGDTFARSGAPSMQRCMEPPRQPGCMGGWTLTAPLNPGSTDCNDADPDAFPGQTMFFTSAATGGGYDYNCMNGDEPRYTVTNADESFCVPFPFGSPTTCLGSDGWTSTVVAACGATASFSDCYDSCITRGCVQCMRRTVTRQQECR